MTVTYTTGDPMCGLCGQVISLGGIHNCPVPVYVSTPFAVGPIQPLPGWECPVCGTGNNPYRATCGNSLCPDMLYKDEEGTDLTKEEIDQAKQALKDEDA